MGNNTIEESIQESIKYSELKDLTKEFGEIALDSILKDGLLKDIPFFSTISALFKTHLNIRDRIFAKKILNFLLELKEIPLEERDEFVSKIQNDENEESKVGETIMLIIDKADDMRKSKLIGKLFTACIQETITYNQFLKLSSIVNRAYVPTLYRLLELNKGKKIEESEYEELFNLNLLNIELEDDKKHLSFTEAGMRRGLPIRGEKPDTFNQKIIYNISINGKLLILALLEK